MANELAKRIKEIRIRHGYKSKQAFADALDTSLNNVKGWENEKKPVYPGTDKLLAMCDLFDCDLDYLTGRISETTHDIHFVSEYTGLSEKAIKKIGRRTIIDDGVSAVKVSSPVASALNELIESDGFADFIDAFNCFLAAADRLGKTANSEKTRTVIKPGEVTLWIDDLTKFYMQNAEKALHDLCMPIFNKSYRQSCANAIKGIKKTDDEEE